MTMRNDNEHNAKGGDSSWSRRPSRLYSVCPLQDSNLRTRLRRPLLYPLS